MTHALDAPTIGRARSPVADAAMATLDQCERLIRDLSDVAYAAPSRVLAGGTVGRHVRHTVDHFAALLAAHEQHQTVDYDRRERGTPMETVRADALAAIGDVRAALATLGAPEMNSPIRVRVMLTARGTEAELTSTLGRELVFAAHHAVHHHAMIKAIATEHGHHAPEEFGKAPSTLAHESAH